MSHPTGWYRTVKVPEIMQRFDEAWRGSSFEHRLPTKVIKETIVRKVPVPDPEIVAKEVRRIVRESHDSQKKKLAAKRIAERKRLADELRSARNHLRRLKKDIQSAEETTKQVFAAEYARQAKAFNESVVAAPAVPYHGEPYKPVPPAFLKPHPEGVGLPDEPGVYFVFAEDGTVEYIGQSVKLSQRVRLGSHNQIQKHHRIGFIPLEPYELTFAECYYIGLCRPRFNFGLAASHQRFPKKPV